MTEEIKAIGERIHGLRDACGISSATLAAECGITEQELDSFERGAADIPVGTLHTIAKHFNVELNTLLTGEEPHLRGYCLTRRDSGVTVNRRLDYQYKSLAYTFADRKAEPFLVTVEPKPASEPIHLNTHIGQEFDYVIEGTLLISLNGKEFTLNEGDSLYYDSGIPHGMKTLNGKSARFLACIF
ncbi:MAG TPA: XRE family transcriptional regulator [Treponemataceae bacterium]|mgnify:FL=1|nr:XRE family transcriptional regulator [Treponemataceae bacterium]HPS45518.1 XRE family transcriptional regulator [Treponemataceae bacterium]